MICRNCDHDRSAHQHFRPGNNCGQCECATFRRRLFGRRPAASPISVPVLQPTVDEIELSRTA